MINWKVISTQIIENSTRAQVDVFNSFESVYWIWKIAIMIVVSVGSNEFIIAILTAGINQQWMISFTKFVQAN